MSTFRLVERPRIAPDLAVPEVALSQDGVFTRSQARSDGWSDPRQRRLLRSGLWVPVTSTILRHRDVPEGPWQRARAVALTGDLVVSHGTAGQLWGFKVPDALAGTSRSSRRTTSVVTHRAALAVRDTVQVSGLRVTTPERTLTDLLCRLSRGESLDLVCDAFRRGLLVPEDLTASVRRAVGREGVGRARFIAVTCAGRPYSVLEWRFQQRVRDLGPGWRFNVEVRDEAGLIGVVDAVHAQTMIVVELDGEEFHGPDRFQRDRTRDQRLIALGFVVMRVTWEDLERRPDDVIERIRRAMAHRVPQAA